MGIQLFFGLFCLLPPHGDLDLRIAALSAAISQHPDSTMLYLERGELYILHEDYALALHDFNRCRHHAIADQRLWAGLGRAYYGLAEPDSAMHYFDRALLQDPDLFSVKESKARLMALLQQHCAGAALYDEILREALHPGPSVFIDASLMWLQCSDADATAKSIRVLEDGMERLGALHVLQKEMVKRYVEFNHLDTALEWQSKIVASSSSPLPLLDRAQLYLQANDTLAAQSDIITALEKLDAFPVHRKSTSGFQQLRARATLLLKQTGQ